MNTQTEIKTSELPQWHGAYDSDGKLRATFDSESEAYHYVRNRGHMDGGSDKPITTDTAMTLIAEYDEVKAHAEALAEALRDMVASQERRGGSPSIASSLNNARATLANWEGVSLR